MVLYTIIAQYRTGGQNLMNWVYQSLHKDFVVIHEPFNLDYTIYTNDTTLQDFDWLEENKKYFIKELWYPNSDYKKMLELSNKTLCLYRENTHEQTISHMYSTKQKKYYHQYTQKDVDKVFNQEEYDKFKSEVEYNKETILEFAQINNLPTLSYENLYYGDGIQFLKDVFDFESNIPFPFGSKYFTKDKKLI